MMIVSRVGIEVYLRRRRRTLMDDAKQEWCKFKFKLSTREQIYLFTNNRYKQKVATFSWSENRIKAKNFPQQQQWLLIPNTDGQEDNVQNE